MLGITPRGTTATGIAAPRPTALGIASLAGTAVPVRADQPRGRFGGFGVVVVVPVRNEELRLERCLTALGHARRRALSGPDRVSSLRVVLVLDRCTDRSSDIAATREWIETVITDHGRVGAARATGIAAALARWNHPLRSTWIACTDGDSAVPADWLHTHLGYAVAGADLVLGTVRPDPAELSSAELGRWHAQHSLAEGHPYVFGANLGISAEMYLAAGGFADVSADEDQRLVHAVRRLRGHVISTAASPVLTSGRLVGRTGAGFAEYLGAMGSDEVQLLTDVPSGRPAVQPSSPTAPATEMAGGRT